MKEGKKRFEEETTKGFQAEGEILKGILPEYEEVFVYIEGRRCSCKEKGRESR